MSGTPQWKVYRYGKNGEYVAATKYAEDAAALVALMTDGVVKYDHKFVVWTEGAETISAAESYDQAAAIMLKRHEEYYTAAKARREGRMTTLKEELAKPRSMTIDKPRNVTDEDWKG